MSLAQIENGQLTQINKASGSVNRLVKIVRSWIPAQTQNDRVPSVHVDISDTGGNILPGIEQDLNNVHNSILVFDNRGRFIFAWTAIITLVCFYNMATLTILIFEEMRTVHYGSWLLANATTDFILILDIFVQSRTGKCCLSYFPISILRFCSVLRRRRQNIQQESNKKELHS
ncbi:hypothetical protein L596_005362 [Steinernema carpocapsae]|uniref:Uncharacterized protein n=1 Tax=Steinernema carpocapsae TaxID=34508 RepID=A0A4U8V0C9_STECR|nr:hypothetical protein L596_005362 [Steinernema carpocapsae]